MTKYFAVLDTETNWKDEVMSIGIVLADEDSYKPIRGKYIIVDPAYKKGGMYSSVLFVDQAKVNRICSYTEAMIDIEDWLQSYGVEKIFAYNARFDYMHLKELQKYSWYDILRIAAYKDTNYCIPEYLPSYKTGRLKSGYGVEPILQMLTQNPSYKEVHNALCDAVDELKIMQNLNLSIEVYEKGRIE